MGATESAINACNEYLEKRDNHVNYLLYSVRPNIGILENSVRKLIT